MRQNHIPANELERLLVDAARDPVARPNFYRALLNSTLFALSPYQKSAEGSRTLGPGEGVKIVHWEKRPGQEQYIPLFTSPERIQEALAGSGVTYTTLGIEASAMFEMLLQGTTPAILNPLCSYGKELTLPEMKNLVSGAFFAPSHTEVVQAKRKVLLGQPSEYPHKLVDSLRRLFANDSRVQAAYLARIHDPESGVPPHILIGLKTVGDIQAVEQDAGVVARECVFGAPVDFTVVGRGGGVDDYFLKQTKPFYVA